MPNMKFWETKTLAQMTTAEWESLCDGCGKCCLVKLEDEDTGEIAFTSVVCDLIDLESCRCTRYSERCTLVPECIDLKQHDFAEYKWLPSTCAYRLLTDGKPLPDWHPLNSGTVESVKDAGVSISSYAIKESQVDDPEDHIIEWLD
ncbi:YcgN family cysteine cluster protein [Methylomonas lenta]|uniref:YcgN family cysteine cluster protein n=1 Tax=Methylomonas lenta TaxID=980561 RepID=UPI0018DBA7C5|nr:YcgN family cysteine cluster protein [Methylomonas lenta]